MSAPGSGSGATTGASVRELYLLGVTFCVLWSSAFIAAKFGLTAAPPLAQLTIRFLFAGALLVGLMVLMGKRWPRNWSDVVTGIILGILNNSIYLGLFFTAMQTVTAGIAALIAALTPLATVVLAQPVLGERLTRRVAAGIALGIIGAVIVLQQRLDAGTDDGTGIVLCLIAMVCLSVGTVLYRKRGSHADPFVMNTIQTVASGIALLPVALLIDDWSTITFNATFFLSVGYLSIMLSIVALLIWFRLIRIAGAGKASSFHFLNPGLGMLFGFVILGEPIAMTDMIGLVPIIGGIILVTWPAKSPGR